MSHIKKVISSIILFHILSGFYFTFSQSSEIIDNIIAVVGDKIILRSDIEQQFLQFKAQGIVLARCEIFEELLIQKLLLNQAELDSITVTDAQVDMQIDQRINRFVEHFGSKAAMEDYFKKSIPELKQEYRSIIYEQLVTQKMQNEIIKGVKITPADVRNFYQQLPADSIPEIGSEIQLNEIVLYPPFTEQAIYEVKEKLLTLRKRILNGEKFSTLAILYSEDATATRGGEVGFMGKGELAPAYAEAAFKLKEGGVSGIVETEFGYHIIQLIEKKDNKVNTRHILLRPKYSPEELLKLRIRLDSIAQLIRTNDSVTFEKAAYRFSQDEDTRKNGGLMINFNQGTSKFTLEELSPVDAYVVKKLKIGEISDPYEAKDKNGKTVYKIIRLKSKTEAHKANLKDDYDFLKKLAESYKQQQTLKEWVRNKQKSTYIKIRDSIYNCDFLQSDGWISGK